MHAAQRWLPLFLTAPLMFAGCDGDGDNDTQSGAEHEAGGEEHGTEGETHGTDGEEHGTDGEEHGTDGEEHGTDGEEDSACAVEERDDVFAIGLSKSGELVSATFVSANPAPPIKGDNVWVMDFTDLNGEPVEGLQITVNPMMPDHGHGTPVETIVTATEVPGRYELADVNLFMTGLWEVNFELTLAGGEQDALMFGFCVE